MPGRRVTNHEVERMRDLARAGRTMTEICLATGRSQRAVRQHAGDLIPRRSGPVVDVDRIRELASMGRSPSFIAAEVGCCEWTAAIHARDIRRQLRRAREERLLRDYESADRSDLPELAARFGYASVGSLQVCVHLRRKRLLREIEEAA